MNLTREHNFSLPYRWHDGAIKQNVFTIELVLLIVCMFFIPQNIMSAQAQGADTQSVMHHVDMIVHTAGHDSTNSHLHSAFNDSIIYHHANLTNFAGHLGATHSSQTITPHHASNEFPAQHLQYFQSVPVNLDLSSTAANVQVGNLPGGHVFINIVGAYELITNGQLVTPAEIMAVNEVLRTGQQTIEVGASGNAIGGSFVLSQHLSQEISSLVVPQGVTAIDISRSGSLNLTGNLTDYGNFYIVTTGPGLNGVSVEANNIYVQAQGILSDVLSTGSLHGLVGVTSSNLNLDLTAQDNIVNAGTISSGGSLSLTAGGSITNSPSSLTNSSSPVIEASGTVNLVSGSGNITNNGLVESAGSNINISSTVPTNDININTAGGIFSATQAINVRDPSYYSTGNIELTGGNYLSQTLNLNSGSGAVTVNVEQITGNLNVNADEAHISASTAVLKLGNDLVNGDPTYYNTGSIEITGAVTATEDTAIIAGGNIFTSALDLTAQVVTNGHNLIMIAGATVSTTGCVGCVPVTSLTGSPASSVPTGQTISVNLNSATGGYIDLSNSTAGTGGYIIDTSSSSGSGGSVSLVALANGANTGYVNLSTATNSINSSGNSSSNGGSVIVYAGGSNGVGNGITAGNITTGGGSLTLETTQATGNLTFNSAGDIQSGSISAGASFTAANILTGGLNTGSGDATIKTAANITVAGPSSGPAINGNNITLTASGASSLITVTGNSTSAYAINGSGTVNITSGLSLIVNGLASGRAITSTDINITTNNTTFNLLPTGTASGNVILGSVDAASGGSTTITNADSGGTINIGTNTNPYSLGSSTTDNIIVKADNIALGTGSTITTKNSGTVTLEPDTSSSNITIGTSGSGLVLNPSAFSGITTGTLQIGSNSNTGELTVSSPITSSDLSNITTLSLQNGKTTGTGIDIEAAISGTNITLSAASTDAVAAIQQGSGDAITATGVLEVDLSGDGTAALNTATTNNVASLTGIGSGTINLNNGGNAIQLNTFGGTTQNVTVTNAGAITTSATTSTDALTLSGTSVTLSNALTASGAANITATTGNVAIASGGSLTTTGSNNISLSATGIGGAISLAGALDSANAVTLSAGSGGISQTSAGAVTAPGGVTVNLASGGTAALNTATTNDVASLTGIGSGTINLNNSGNAIQLNTFGGTAQAVTVTNAGAITTGTSATSTAALTLSGTSVTLSGAITAAGDTSITASTGNVSVASGGSLTTTSSHNVSLSATSTGGAISLAGALDSANNITLSVGSGSISQTTAGVITAPGSLTVNLASGGTAALTQNNSVGTLQGSGPNSSIAGTIDFSNSGALVIGTMKANGNESIANLTVSAAGAITTSAGTTGLTGLTTIQLTSTGGSSSIAISNPLGNTSTNTGITLTANAISLGAAIETESSGTVTLEPYTTSDTITIGTSGSGLVLDPTTFSNVTAGTLQVGSSSDTGTLTVNAAVTGTELSNVTTLSLQSGKTSGTAIDISSTIGSNSTSANMVLNSSGGGGNIVVENTGSLTNAGGDSYIQLTADGDISLSGDISSGGTTGGTITLESANTTTINTGVQITANGTSGAGGMIQLAPEVAGESEPVTVVNNGTIEATNTADTSGIIGFNGSAFGSVTVTGTGTIHAGSYVGFGDLDPVTLEVSDPSTVSITASFTAGNISVQQGANIVNEILIGHFPPPTPPTPTVPSNALLLLLEEEEEEHEEQIVIQNKVDEQIGTRIATDYTPVLNLYHPYEGSIAINDFRKSNEETNEQKVFMATISSRESIASLVRQLVQQGTQLSTDHDASYLNLQRGNVLFNPTYALTVRTQEGEVTVPKNSLVLVMETGHDVAIFNLHDPKSGSVHFSASGKTIVIHPGREAVFTRNKDASFEQLNPGRFIAYRNVQQKELENNIRVFTADFSIASALFELKPLKDLLRSNEPYAQHLTDQLLKNASILADVFNTGGPYTSWH